MHTGKAIRYYSYSSLLFSQNKKRQLRNNIMRYNDRYKLFCSCNKNSKCEIQISENLMFHFLPGGTHTAACMNHIKKLQCFIEQSAIKAFLHPGAQLPVNFIWSKGSRKKGALLNKVPALNKMNFELSDIIYVLCSTYVTNNTFYEIGTINDFLRYMQFELSCFTLKNTEGEILKLSFQNFFRPDLPDNSITFTFAMVIKIYSDYKNKVYLTCQSADRRFSVSVSKKLWDKVYEYVPGLHLFVSGIIRTRDVTVFKRGHYDSITHISYTSKPESYKDNELIQFTLFYTDEHGVLCFDAAEHEYLSNLRLSKTDVEATYFTSGNNNVHYYLPGITEETYA